METTRRQRNPGLLPLLPLIYLAWADGDLSASELEAIRAAAAEQPWLDKARREQLGHWLDPDSPPSAAELADVLEQVRRAAAGLPEEQAQGLAALCHALVEREREAGELPDETRDALERLETLLGVSGSSALRGLLNPERPDPDSGEYGVAVELEPRQLAALLDGPEHELVAALRTKMANPRYRPDPDWTLAEHREARLRWVAELAGEGHGRVAFPGVTCETGFDRFLAVFAAVACSDLSLVIKYGVQFGLFGGAIYHLGSDEQRERWLPAIAEGEHLGCFAMTEAAHGSNVRDLETTARYDKAEDVFVLTTPHDEARKAWIGNAALHGRSAVVFAQLEVAGVRHGVHALMVPIRDQHGATLPGVRALDHGHKMGLQGIDNGQLWFDGVKVPRDRLLCRHASVDADGHYHSPLASSSRRFFTMIGTLVGGRLAVAKAGLAAARIALTTAVRYGERRRQFGPEGRHERKLLDYPSHQRRLLPRLASLVCLELSCNETVARLIAARGEGEPSSEDVRKLEAQAAGVKALATEFARDALRECRAACGANGYLAEHRFGELIADADIFVTFEGDNTVLLQLVAKSLLTDFRQQFSDDRLWGVLRYLVGRAASALAERTPMILRRGGDWLERDAQLAALRYRTTTLLDSVARRIRGRLGEGVDPFDAFADCQNHLIRLAQAAVEQRVLRDVAAVEARLLEQEADEGLRLAIGQLGDLFALSRLEADVGWFLERDHIDGGRARALREHVERLCGELRPQARTIVDGLGLPAGLLPPFVR